MTALRLMENNDICLTVGHEASSRGGILLYLDRELQNSVFQRLTQTNPIIPASWIAYELKKRLEQNNPGLKLRLKDFNIHKIADFIGFRKGHWPNPYEWPIWFEDRGEKGFLLHAPQSKSEAVIDLNGQQYIYNAIKCGIPSGATSDALMSLNDNGALAYPPLEKATVHRLRYTIKHRSENHPPWEKYHWQEVTKPFKSSKIHKVPSKRSQPQEPQNPAPPRAAPPLRRSSHTSR